MTTSQHILRRISILLLIVSGSGLLLFLSFLLLIVSFAESYCTFQPDIDTTFAKGFTEAKLDRIRAGMDSVQVSAILGSPLEKQVLDPADYVRFPEIAPPYYTVIWHYSTDGKCEWFDFAWLGREVWFDKTGKVVSCVRGIRYD